jgi:peptidyl-prolyl cis-trans isomerase B (cyclophilin B)
MNVKMTTNMGSFVIALNAEKAPKTVANFLAYVDAGFYENTLFHRVIDNFMIQGGGMNPDMTNKDDKFPPVENEANNGLKNQVGTIAMARTMDPHSASSQFFINVKNNDFLNFRSETMDGWGYCVFGEIIEGMEVVNAIKAVETTRFGAHGDVPKEKVLIEKAERVE